MFILVFIHFVEKGKEHTFQQIEWIKRERNLAPRLCNSIFSFNHAIFEFTTFVKYIYLVCSTRSMILKFKKCLFISWRERQFETQTTIQQTKRSFICENLKNISFWAYNTLSLSTPTTRSLSLHPIFSHYKVSRFTHTPTQKHTHYHMRTTFSLSVVHCR